MKCKHESTRDWAETATHFALEILRASSANHCMEPNRIEHDNRVTSKHRSRLNKHRICDSQNGKSFENKNKIVKKFAFNGCWLLHAAHRCWAMSWRVAGMKINKCWCTRAWKTKDEKKNMQSFPLSSRVSSCNFVQWDLLELRSLRSRFCCCRIGNTVHVALSIVISTECRLSAAEKRLLIYLIWKMKATMETG